MKKIFCITSILIFAIFSCATPKLCESYSEHYSEKRSKNNYCNGSKEDRTRKRLFKKYLSDFKKPDSSLILIERVGYESNLDGAKKSFTGHSIYFIKDNNFEKLISYIPRKDAIYVDTDILTSSYSDFNTKPSFLEYVLKNGIYFDLEELKKKKEYWIDLEFGFTILTEFDKNLKIKGSKIYDKVIILTEKPGKIDMSKYK